jgi:hypothetical protein
MDIRELVKNTIEQGDYDGLYNEEGECACLGDFPCEAEGIEDCKFGYYKEVPENLKEEFSFMISGVKPDSEFCSACKGYKEIEVSAGSHSFFKKCEKCNGTGKAKN